MTELMKWVFAVDRFMSYCYCEKCMNEMVREFSYDEDDIDY